VNIDDDVAERDAEEIRAAINRLKVKFPERKNSFNLNEITEERENYHG